MTRKKDKYSKFDKSLLKDGTKIPGSENWTTSPRDWEGYLDRKGKDILWELEETNIPELQNRGRGNSPRGYTRIFKEIQ